MMRPTLAFLCLALATLASAVDLPLPVADLQRSEPVDFGKEIMPILKRSCVACHHTKESEGGLILESFAGLQKGGDGGPAVVAKDLAASLLFSRATGSVDPLMPPEDNDVGAKPLTPEELGLIKLWIEQGATGSDAAMTESIQWQPIPESIRTVYALDIAPNGQFAAVGRGNRIAIVDLENYAEVGKLVDPSLQLGEVADVDLIQSIAFSPDGQRIASGGFRTVRLWRKTRATVDLASTPLSAAAGLVAVNRDHSRAAMVNAIGDLEVWDLKIPQRLQTLTGHLQPITALAIDSDRVVSGDQSGRLICWNPADGSKLAELQTAFAITALSVSGNDIATVNAERKAQLFRVNQTAIELVFESLGGLADATSVAMVEKPAPLAIAASEGSGVLMVNRADNQVVRKVDHGGAVSSVAVTHDEAKLITGGRDGKLKVWNVADGNPILTTEGEPINQLVLAQANRDAARQKNAVAQLNNQTPELEKLLANENEVVKKTTEEHTKAGEALVAEDKKVTDALAVVTATETKLATATADATKATEMIEASTLVLTTAKSATESIAKEIEAQKTELAAAQEAAKTAEAQLTEAKAKAEQIQKEIEAKEAAMKQADEDGKQAQVLMPKRSASRRRKS
jgi:WD40 repeat protein